MFAGVNMFWARLRLILARAAQENTLCYYYCHFEGHWENKNWKKKNTHSNLNPKRYVFLGTESASHFYKSSSPSSKDWFFVEFYDFRYHLGFEKIAFNSCTNSAGIGREHTYGFSISICCFYRTIVWLLFSLAYFSRIKYKMRHNARQRDNNEHWIVCLNIFSSRLHQDFSCRFSTSQQIVRFLSLGQW